MTLFEDVMYSVDEYNNMLKIINYYSQQKAELENRILKSILKAGEAQQKIAIEAEKIIDKTFIKNEEGICKLINDTMCKENIIRSALNVYEQLVENNKLSSQAYYMSTYYEQNPNITVKRMEFVSEVLVEDTLNEMKINDDRAKKKLMSLMTSEDMIKYIQKRYNIVLQEEVVQREWGKSFRIYTQGEGSIDKLEEWLKEIIEDKSIIEELVKRLPYTEISTSEISTEMTQSIVQGIPVIEIEPHIVRKLTSDKINENRQLNILSWSIREIILSKIDTNVRNDFRKRWLKPQIQEYDKNNVFDNAVIERVEKYLRYKMKELG